VLNFEQKQAKESQQTETKPFDVYIVSHGDMTKEKMELLSDFWKSGIRADADFNNNFGKTENQHSQNQSLMLKARFLLTLKRQVYIGSGKMKVKDFSDVKNEKDREEHRDAIVDYIRQKLIIANK
jgi:histidyl-tRNA synthetase